MKKDSGQPDIPKTQKAFKLLKLRANNTLGPLFIDSRLVIPEGVWIRAENHRRAGYQYRPGWHAAPKPFAPHLTEKGRVWCEVELDVFEKLHRPDIQGGAWYLARWMKVVKRLL